MDDTTWDFASLLETHVAEDRSARARVRRLVETILADPGAPHDVERLAQRAAVSPRTLSRLFRRETGTTPARFVERARLRLAQVLIERSTSAIASVAARSGFRNAERMRRAFRRTLGVSPRGYASSGCGTIRK
jgi:transcriptional regulator GlxA family with amidase domain